MPIETVENYDGEMPRATSSGCGDFYLPYLAAPIGAGRQGRRQAPRSTATATAPSRRSPSSPRSWPPSPTPPRASASSATRSSPSTPSRRCGSSRATCRWTPPGRHADGDTRLVPPRARAAARPARDPARRARGPEAGHLPLSHDGERHDRGRRDGEPFGLFFLNQHWYLAARAPGDDIVKNFRLNRIGRRRGEQGEAGHARLRDPGRLPPPRARPLPPGLGARRRRRDRGHRRRRSRSGAAAAALRLGEAVDGHPDRRRFRIRRTDAFARWLLSFGGDLVPVSPAGAGGASIAAWFARRSSTITAAAMSTTAADQLRRILHLIPRLADGEPHSLAEVARLAGVDRDGHAPGHRVHLRALRGAGRVRRGSSDLLDADDISVVPNHFLRPMRLTRSELLALELGLAMLRGERPPEEHRAIERRDRPAPGGGREAPEARRSPTTSAPPRSRPPATWSTSAACARRSARRRKVRLTLPEGGRGGRVQPGDLSLRHRVRQRDVVRRGPVREHRRDPDLPARPGGAGGAARRPLRVAARVLAGRDRAGGQGVPGRRQRARSGCGTRRGSRAGSPSGKGRPLAEDGSLTLEHPLADTRLGGAPRAPVRPRRRRCWSPKRCARRWCAGSSG